jgi:glycosyltransferase involved in cell wall biosynthesis
MIPNIDVQNFYSRTNADCFISLGANEVSHEMAEYGRILGVPTIVGIASDQSLRNTVFCGSMVLNEYRVPSYHAWEAMHQATSVLVQTQWQSDWLYRKAGRRGSLVPNPIPRGWEKHIPTRERHFTYDFLWVGRPTADKNPEIIFELARELGSARFRMVMDGGLAAIHERWRFNLPANILLTDRLGSQEELRALMGSSRAIINSSPMEGFPNLMLQGAMVGCPCIFLNVDPDGWGALHGCAASARGDVEAFLGLLAKVLRDPSWLDTMAARAFQRATERHSPEVVKDQLIDAVTQTLRQTKKARV